MKKHTFFYRNGLSIVFLSLFIAALLAQALTGWKEHNGELSDAGRTNIAFGAYLHTGHFISATFENFQSEFLQMALYVVMTYIFDRKVLQNPRDFMERKRLTGSREITKMRPDRLKKVA